MAGCLEGLYSTTTLYQELLQLPPGDQVNTPAPTTTAIKSPAKILAYMYAEENSSSAIRHNCWDSQRHLFHCLCSQYLSQSLTEPQGLLTKCNSTRSVILTLAGKHHGLACPILIIILTSHDRYWHVIWEVTMAGGHEYAKGMKTDLTPTTTTLKVSSPCQDLQRLVVRCVTKATTQWKWALQILGYFPQTTQMGIYSKLHKATFMLMKRPPHLFTLAPLLQNGLAIHLRLLWREPLSFHQV